jgi:tripartite-type tricarboxylate transporter receptor subunit TctC
MKRADCRARVGAHQALAQPYPQRTVSVIVPYPAGGSVDVVARPDRAEAQREHGRELHRGEPRRGAGGAVGANVVVKGTDPDGYTLMLTASIHIITPFLNEQDSVRRREGFRAGVARRVRPLIVSTAPNMPATSLMEFLRSRAQGRREIHARDVELRLGRAPCGRVAQARCSPSTRW